MLPAALAVFFASGFAALIYQVAWQRTLTLFSGADVHSATIVVAAFMAGLGCGSLAGGHLADRLTRARALMVFAAAELAVGLFGFASTWLFYDVLYAQAGSIGLGLAVTAAILFFALLWPTFFMGMSLPLLARGLTDDVDRAAPTVGWLYAANTLGAAAGAMAGTWAIVPNVGLERTVWVAAALNLACASAALPLARVQALRSSAPDVTQLTPRSPRLGFPLWAALFALSGFLALSLEIVWFRLLGVMLKSNAFTFGTLLALYLSGLGLGTAIGSLVASRVRRPAFGFFLAQAGAGVYQAAALSMFVSGLGWGEPFEWFWRYFAEYDPLSASRPAADWVRLYVLLPLGLIGPPTVLSGLSFPLLQRVVQTDLSHVGRRVGALIAANIAGSTAGAVLTGWVFLRWLGTPGTTILLLVCSAVFGFFGVREAIPPRRMRLAYAIAGTLIAGLSLAVPRADALWSRLHGSDPQNVIVGEDGSGLSLIRGERNFRPAVVFVGGLGQSWIPYGGVHTVLGALPAFLHPSPTDAAIIGLGSGDTLHALAGRRELARITSIEIVAPQLSTLRALATRQRTPGVAALLADRRIEHVFADGRLYLRQAGRRYDIIEADALRPTSAHAGNLYSEAYFRLLLDHLKPGGLAVSWAPTERTARTFLRVFPHVWRHGEIMIGSNAPIPYSEAAIRARLTGPVRDYFTAAEVDIVATLEPVFAGGGEVFGPAHDRTDLTDINTDLYPKDEFNLATDP